MKDFNDHIISDNRSVVDALTQINQLSGNLNLTLFVCDSQGKMLGTLTDGDFRRGFMKGLKLDDSIDSFMVKNFRHFTLNDINVAHIKELRAKQIKLVPLLDEDGRIIKVYDFTQRKTILPVDAVLMAGGRGERLRPLTDTTPKPMLLIGNKPIIEHNIDNLTTNGIDNFFVTVNYLADQIVNHLGNGEKKGIRIECVKETKPLGTIGSVSLIKNFNNDTVLIMNSDLFTNINFEDFYLDFVEKNAAMSIASVPYQISVPYAVLNQDNETVDSFEEKPTYTYHANAGIYLIKKELLDIIPISTHFNATDFIQALLNSGRKVIKYPIIGYWIDIGKHEDYNKAQEFAKHINSQS